VLLEKVVVGEKRSFPRPFVDIGARAVLVRVSSMPSMLGLLRCERTLSIAVDEGRAMHGFAVFSSSEQASTCLPLRFSPPLPPLDHHRLLVRWLEHPRRFPAVPVARSLCCYD